MPVTITCAAESQTLNVLGEALCPLTPAGQALSVQVFDSSAPQQSPGEAGPPPHRHPWDEIYVVLSGILEIFDGETWREAKAGACVTVPAGQWHAADAEITTFPPDMNAAAALAARNAVELMRSA
jgi:cupin domain